MSSREVPVCGYPVTTSSQGSAALTLEPERRWPREPGTLWGAWRPSFSQGSAAEPCGPGAFSVGEALLRRSSSAAGVGLFGCSASSCVSFGDFVFGEVVHLSCRSPWHAVFHHLPFILCATYSDASSFHAFFEVVSGPKKAHACGSAGACLR